MLEVKLVVSFLFLVFSFFFSFFLFPPFLNTCYLLCAHLPAYPASSHGLLILSLNLPALIENWTTVSKEVDTLHAWSNLYYYTPINEIYKAWHTMLLHRSAGPLPKANKQKKKASAALQAPAASGGNSDTSI